MRPIMIIEDDPNSRILTERVIVNAGIKNPIIHFVRGGEALLHLERELEQPIVILLDLKLPDMHGIDLLKYVRNHAKQEIRELCVFILTVSDEQEAMIETIDKTYDAFLRKNLEIGMFLEVVQDCGVQLDIG